MLHEFARTDLGIALLRIAQTRPKTRGDWLLVLAGVNLMWLNFVLVQHMTVAFRHDEKAIILFALAYFAGLSAGYFLSHQIGRREIQTALPLGLVLQLSFALGLQSMRFVLLQIFDEWSVTESISAGLTDGLLLLMLATGGTSIYAVFLPQAVSAGGDLRRCYSLEIMGGIVGLALMPVFMHWGHTWMWGGYSLIYCTLMVLAGCRLWIVLPTVGVVALVMVHFAEWDRAAAKWFYRQHYGWHVDEVLDSKFTPYHKVEVLRSGSTRRLVLNGKRQFGGNPRLTYAYFVAEYPARLIAAENVAVMGCGSMATVGRIGHLTKRIDIVDIDTEVFEASRVHFQDYNHLDELDNWTFTADDAKHWIATTPGIYDLILHDIPPARSRQIALTYTREFFANVKRRLSPDGVFSISSLSPDDVRSAYSRRLFATLGSVFDNYIVIVSGGSAYFYGGGPELRFENRDRLRERVDRTWREHVVVYSRDQIEAMVGGEIIITSANVGDLIYDN